MSLSRILQNPELQASIKSEHEAKSAKIAEHFSDRISHICHAKNDIILHPKVLGLQAGAASSWMPGLLSSMGNKSETPSS